MIQKDYLMRMFQLFMDALNKISNNIEKGEVNIASDQIEQLYELLGNDVSCFLESKVETITLFFQKKDNEFIKKNLLLSELMYYNSLIENEDRNKLLFLEKAISLLEYNIENTNEYSFDANNLLIAMKDELLHFSNFKQF